MPLNVPPPGGNPVQHLGSVHSAVAVATLRPTVQVDWIDPESDLAKGQVQVHAGSGTAQPQLTPQTVVEYPPPTGPEARPAPVVSTHGALLSDPAAFIRSLSCSWLRQRLAELDGEREALLVLLAAASARDRAEDERVKAERYRDVRLTDYTDEGDGPYSK